MIKQIAVIGTGVIGAGWIIRVLAHNKKVIAYDKNVRLEKKLISEIKRVWPSIKKLYNNEIHHKIKNQNPLTRVRVKRVFLLITSNQIQSLLNLKYWIN